MDYEKNMFNNHLIISYKTFLKSLLNINDIYNNNSLHIKLDNQYGKIKLAINNILTSDSINNKDIMNILDYFFKEIFRNHHMVITEYILDLFIKEYGEYIILDELSLYYLCKFDYGFETGIIEKLYNESININLNVSSYEDDYNTSVIISAKNNNIKSLLFLIDKNKDKIDVNIRNIHGNTALHYACKNNFIEIVKILLSNNADISIKNCGCLNPLLLAIKEDCKNIIDILLDNYKSKEWHKNDPIDYTMEYIKIYDLKICEEIWEKLEKIMTNTKSASKI